MSSHSMTENTRNSIVEQIGLLVNNVVIEQQQIDQVMRNFTEGSPRPLRLMNVEGVTLMFLEEAIKRYTQLMERLLQEEGWGEKFSEEYLGKAIKKIVALAIKEGSAQTTEQHFDQLVDEFEAYSQKHIVYIPLSNIQMQDDAFSMGNIVFRRMTEAFVNELIGKMTSIIMLTLRPPKAKETTNKLVKQRLENWKGMICSEFQAVAEPQRARERAEEETRYVLDLLRYAIPSLYPKGLNVAVGLEGEVVRVARSTLILSLDEQSAELPTNLKGSLCSFDLTPVNIDIMEQIGIFKVTRVLQNHHRTDFERTLLRGIHWFATSQTQFERENQFLNLMTCLETFLAPPNGKQIKDTVAEGAAYLLATDPDTQKVLKDRVRDLYSLRSEISHGGQGLVLEQHLTELATIARELIFQMIERKEEFTTQKSLVSWLKNQRS